LENSALITWGIPILTGILGLVGGVIIEKFKERNVSFLRKITHFHMGTTSQSPQWGRIEVLHQGRVTNHLSFVTVEFSNKSSKNFVDVFVDVWVDPNNQILGFTGNYKETRIAIHEEESYTETVSAILQEREGFMQARQMNPDITEPANLSQNVIWALTNKVFHLPVFNRNTSVTITLLVENFNGQTPVLSANVNHVGVKVIDQEDKDTENLRVFKGLAGWSVIIYLIFFFFMFRNYGYTNSLILASIFCISYNVLGAFLYFFFRYLRKAFF